MRCILGCRHPIVITETELVSSEDIQSVVRKRPFEPFRLHMSNGMTVDVRHPEMILVADEAMVVAIFDEKKQKNFLHHYSVIKVNVIEPLPVESESENGAG